MPVDVGQENIRIRVRNPDDFVQDSFRTITISDDQGIKAVIGKLSSDPGGSTHIQSYIFDKSKWTAAEAESWVKDHKRSHERRCIDPEPSEMRLEFNKAEGAKVRGYAAVFNAKTVIGKRFFEQVLPGAFTDTIRDDNVYALWNHDWSMPLADVKSGTLRLWEDEKGLAYELNPGDTDYANNLIKNIKRGVVRQSSFGFDIVKQNNSINAETKELTRTIEKVRLYDVSPVTLAAYPQTEGLYVRMTISDDETLFTDGDEVIEIIPQKPAIKAPTDEELFKQFEEMKKSSI